jgi:hypothetical protein
MSDRCKPPKGTRKTPVPRRGAGAKIRILRLTATTNHRWPAIPTTAVEILNSIRARTNTV